MTLEQKLSEIEGRANAEDVSVLCRALRKAVDLLWSTHELSKIPRAAESEIARILEGQP